ACTGLLLLPAAGQAAQVFGSDLRHQPTQPACAMLGPCTIAGFVEVPAEGQLSTAGAPIDGVITKFRIRAKVETPVNVALRLVNIRPQGLNPDSALATTDLPGPFVTLKTATDEDPPQEFPARVLVKKGQHLGLDAPGRVFVTYDSSGDKLSYEYAPPLVGGEREPLERLSNGFLGELLVQATVEPDGDGDGHGDETQDACPSQKTTRHACDLTKPAIAKLRVAKGKIFYRLSEAATVKLKLARKNARGKFRAVGRPFSGPGNAGPNRRSLPRAAKLGQGVYRLSVTATDPAGNSGVKKKVFRVKVTSILFVD
ncbi:MAG: hypothetical protein WBL45_04775, partial [Solirubrobacterales bacterium]